MGVVKLLRPNTEVLSLREAARKNFMDSVLKRADGIAFDQDKRITAETRHLVYALIYELSEAFLTNNEMAAAINSIGKALDQTRADLEALRSSVK
jgi:predicted esterase